MAHAYFPEDGRVHFDEDEDFTDSIRRGKSLLAIAVHEFGHVLGLGHSYEINAIMFPGYFEGTPAYLRQDDIDGIRAIYSKHV